MKLLEIQMETESKAIKDLVSYISTTVSALNPSSTSAAQAIKIHP